MTSQPNHGWRHVQAVAPERMDPEIRDAIKGHAPRTEGEHYGGDVPIGAKWIEIIRLMRYEIEPPTEPPVLMWVRKKKSAGELQSSPKKLGRPPGRRPAAVTAT